MSDDAAPPPPRPANTPSPMRELPPPPRTCGWVGCLALGFVVLVAGGAFGGATLVASRSLDRRFTRLQAELASAQAALQPERAPIISSSTGGPPDASNAVDDYRAVEWVLGPAQDLRRAPPGAGLTGLSRNHPATSGVDPNIRPPSGKDSERMCDAGERPTEPMQRALDLYGPLERHVRDGVRRSRCDWQADLSRGASMRLPNLMAYRSIATIMMWQAQDQPPLEAARTGLVIAAFGRDLSRHPTLIALMTSVAIRGIGVRTVVRALGRGLEREGLDEVLATLGRLEPFDAHRGLADERVRMQIELARMTGRTLSPDVAVSGAEEAGALATLGPAFFDHEWTGLLEAYEGMQALLERPPAERAQAQREVEARLEGYPFASRVVPNFVEMQAAVDQSNVEVLLARLLVAAHLDRLETGVFPQDPKLLAPRLGGAALQDPFWPRRPLQLAVHKDELRAWSVGRNGVDDHGVGPSDRADVVLITHIPPAEPGQGAR